MKKVNSDLIFLKEPLLSRKYMTELLELTDEKIIEKKLLEYYENKNVKQAICSSSLSFYHALNERIKKNKPIDDLVPTLYSYLSRLSLRSTSFGMMSSISSGVISTERRIDFSKRSLILTQLKDLNQKGDELFLVNPTLYKLGDHCFFNDWKDEGQIRNFSLKSLKLNQALRNLLTFLEKPNKKNAVHKMIMVYLKCNHSKAEEYLESLKKEGLVITSFDPRDLGQREKIVRDLDKLKLSDGESLGTDSAIYDVLMSNQLNDFSLDKKTSDKVYKAAQILSNIYYGEFFKRSYHQLLDEFKRKFLMKYSDQSLSILEIMDHNISISFDSGDKLEKTKSNHEMLRFLEKQIFKGENTLRGEWCLTNEDIVTLSSLSTKNHFQSHYKSNLKFIEFSENNETKIYLKSSPCGSSFSSFYRFNHISDELKSKLKGSFEEDYSDSEMIYAELEYYPSRRISAYTRKEPLSKYYIPITGLSDDSSRIPILLNDLFISIINHKIILWSKSLNKRIIPLCLNNYNFLYDPLPIVRLLYSIAKQDHPDFLRWIWPNEIFTNFFPRVSYQGVIFSPKRWVFSKEEILNSIGRKEFHDYYQLDPILNIMDGDTFISVNIKNTKLFKSIVRKMDSEKIMLEECLEVKGDSRDFCREFSISATLNPPIPSLKSFDVNRLALRKNNNLINELDGYLVLNIRLHPELRFSCLKELEVILEKYKWFYIFYFSNDQYELRIRAFDLSIEEIQKLRIEILQSLKSMTLKKMILSFYEEPYQTDEDILDGEDGKYLVDFYQHSSQYFLGKEYDHIDFLFQNNLDYLKNLMVYLEISFDFNSVSFSPLTTEQHKIFVTLKRKVKGQSFKIENLNFPNIELTNPIKFFFRIIHMSCLRIDALSAQALERASIESLNSFIQKND